MTWRRSIARPNAAAASAMPCSVCPRQVGGRSADSAVAGPAADLARAERAGDGARRRRVREGHGPPAGHGGDVVDRPGALNMVTAAGLAMANRLPVLLLPGDTFTGRGRPGAAAGRALRGPDHDANDAFRAVSRYYDRITRPEQLRRLAAAGGRVLTDPADCGPVVLALPQDVQAEELFPAAFFEPGAHRVPGRGLTGGLRPRRPCCCAGAPSAARRRWRCRYSGAGTALLASPRRTVSRS